LDIDFGAGFGDFGDFNNVDDLVDVFNDDSYDFMDDRAVLRRDERHLLGSRHRARRSNQLYHIESVKTSMWYKRFTEEGSTRYLTHELLSSDRNGAFVITLVCLCRKWQHSLIFLFTAAT
jgi:hypothetical protein